MNLPLFSFLLRSNPQIRPVRGNKKSASAKNVPKNQKTNGSTTNNNNSNNKKIDSRFINRKVGDDKLKHNRKDSVTSSSNVRIYYLIDLVICRGVYAFIRLIGYRKKLIKRKTIKKKKVVQLRRGSSNLMDTIQI